MEHDIHTEVVAQARDNPDICVSGGNQLLRNFTSMHSAARAVWAQFELLLLQQGVLYIKSAAHTTQAKLRMLVEKALVEVHDGVVGAHLRGMKSLMKI
ncbi:hypothetical protein pdam_00023505 [Pocillopora damicornis]|uniref:Uncharacterized protein n=1 Tax=Pocillopora damicornis TaxID=46731 RepID=A0A3M6UYC0_POCDA|nr:hypothetical protein pdam_00023505 [Pocillopora damicornis]